ncbi:MAG: ATP-binding protein [Acutalibacteraceae bacterium]
MNRKEKYDLACRILSVSVFRSVSSGETVEALTRFLLCAGSTDEKLRLYADFVSSLNDDAGSLSDSLKKAVCRDENVYITSAAKGKTVSPSILSNAEKELELFSALTRLSPEALFEDTDYEGYIPRFENSEIDFVSYYKNRVENIGRYGYGVFASCGMFRVEEGEIIPVETADEISVESFIGYERERQQVMENTRALTEGRPAANVLLCGDAGTGKSSTVKAAANYYFDRGVRLIEVRKDQLFSLPHIMDRISGNPLKFIIFIDDLSFNKNDDCFSMLKAALEGSASAKASNAVIYATSNRRHIVKEQFSDRAGSDDIHHSDTVQELLSLSERFGLVVYFSRPGKNLYLEIVHELAEREGVTLAPEELDRQAEAFALARGSRSPRAAEQFVKSLL